jgi:hypothetical protein
MNYRKCHECGNKKLITEFSSKKRFRIDFNGNIKIHDQYYTTCKICRPKLNAEKDKEWHKKYGEKNKDKIIKQRKEFYKKCNQLWIDIIMSIINNDIKCELCGYNKEFSAIDFHHKNPNKKEYEIYQIIRGGKTPTLEKIELLKKELPKCMIVCSNCHREIHSKYSYKLIR